MNDHEHQHLHVHLDSVDEKFLQLLSKIIHTGERIMATLQQVKDAVAAEAAEVKTKVDQLEADVQALKDQIAAGTAATAADLDDLLTQVQNIFTPK